MSYLTDDEIKALNLKSVGRNVKISRKASLYNVEGIEIGDNCRIDDFCVISGNITLGRYIHITPMCLVAGGVLGLTVGDFSTFAYGVKIFTQSDDYSGETMCNSLIPKVYKNEVLRSIEVGRQVIIGAGATIMPGADIAEGCAIGSMSLILKPTEPWGIYAGAPAKRIKDRTRELLVLEELFLSEQYK